MQMATDPQFGRFGSHAGVDHLVHETCFHNFINFQDESTTDFMSWPPLAPSILQPNSMNLSHAMNTPDVTTWNIEAPPQHPTSNKPTIYTPRAGHHMAEQGRIVEEDGMMLEPSEVSPAVNLLQTSQYPTPSDWARWKPMILEMYKHGTARMILKKLHAEGFHVT